MAENVHHEHLVKELTDLLQPVFARSPQAVYLYLDDAHKACNDKFAQLLGYSSPEEWVENEFPVDDITEEDQQKGIESFMEASEQLKATTLPLTWLTKSGEKISTTVTMVPLSYAGEVFVLHFIEPTTLPN